VLVGSCVGGRKVWVVSRVGEEFNVMVGVVRTAVPSGVQAEKKIMVKMAIENFFKIFLEKYYLPKPPLEKEIGFVSYPPLQCCHRF